MGAFIYDTNGMLLVSGADKAAALPGRPKRLPHLLSCRSLSKGQSRACPGSSDSPKAGDLEKLRKYIFAVNVVNSLY